MYIHDDIVYYCGLSSINSVVKGIVGYFDPAELLSSQVTFHTLPVPPLTLVNKLVAQDEPNGTGVEIFALGEHRWTDTITVGNEHQFVHHLNRQFIQCKDITQNIVYYDTMEYSSMEVYYDVLLTDNYVVFVGHVTTAGSCSPCLRVKDRFNATIPGYLDYVHFFYTNTYDVHSTMHSTSMEGDLIATAYMHTDASTGIVTNQVRVFNVIGNNVVMADAQEYTVPEKSEVTDIVYIPSDKSIVCMQDFETPLNVFNTNFVYLNPAATAPYTAFIEYIKGEYFKSMTRMKDEHYLASMGPRWFLKNKLTVGGYLNPACPLIEEIKINLLENDEEINVYIQLPNAVKFESVTIGTTNVVQRAVSVICNN